MLARMKGRTIIAASGGGDDRERGGRSSGSGASKKSMFDALRVPRYGFLLGAGWVWGLARWGIGFLGAYLANQLTGSARMVQLTGVAMWAPLLLGGVAGGVIADRLNRRGAIIAQFVTIIPLAVLLGVAGLTDRLELWMVYPFMVVVGTGWVIDMTCRRTIIYELVGPERLNNAMALESLSSATGLALGALIGGTAIKAIGIGPAFLVIAGLMGLAMLLFLPVPVAPVNRVQVSDGPGPMTALRQGFSLLRTEPKLVSILGVTSAVNFFYFSFTPLVQQFGTRLGVDAMQTGLLASMTGFGMMTGSTYVARAQPHRRGMAYIIGSLGAMVLLVPFALSTVYPLSLIFLLLSGIGMGLFGSMQGTLVMTAVPDEVRGRALGLLSTAIGVLPVGMIGLGELAEVVGAPRAVTISVLTGATLTVIWIARHPQVLKLTA
jgi:predicted MFS family arabinose efflux permease